MLVCLVVPIIFYCHGSAGMEQGHEICQRMVLREAMGLLPRVLPKASNFPVVHLPEEVSTNQVAIIVGEVLDGRPLNMEGCVKDFTLSFPLAILMRPNSLAQFRSPFQPTPPELH